MSPENIKSGSVTCIKVSSNLIGKVNSTWCKKTAFKPCDLRGTQVLVPQEWWAHRIYSTLAQGHTLQFFEPEQTVFFLHKNILQANFDLLKQERDLDEITSWARL
jgi:hypothetical protein